MRPLCDSKINCFGAKVFWKNCQIARENVFFAGGSCGKSLIRKAHEIIHSPEIINGKNQTFIDLQWPTRYSQFLLSTKLWDAKYNERGYSLEQNTTVESQISQCSLVGRTYSVRNTDVDWHVRNNETAIQRPSKQLQQRESIKLSHEKGQH